jgi:hypothetical protein
MILDSISHPGALLMREENFLSTQFLGKEDTGNLGAVNAGSF